MLNFQVCLAGNSFFFKILTHANQGWPAQRATICKLFARVWQIGCSPKFWTPRILNEVPMWRVMQSAIIVALRRKRTAHPQPPHFNLTHRIRSNYFFFIAVALLNKSTSPSVLHVRHIFLNTTGGLHRRSHTPLPLVVQFLAECNRLPVRLPIQPHSLH